MGVNTISCLYLIVYLFILSNWSLTVLGEEQEKELKWDDIAPDVVDSVPHQILGIKYPSGVEVNLGNELTPTQVKDQPSVIWNADSDSYYTLIKVDPDAPSRKDPKFRNFCHWLVVNIPGADVSRGDVIFDYMGAGAPRGTAIHRYVFLVYKQPAKIDFTEPRVGSKSRRNRKSFSARKFAEKYNLGKPIAGNFYGAQWDPYVDIRNKEITN